MSEKELIGLALFLTACIFLCSWLSGKFFGKPCEMCGGRGERWNDEQQAVTRCPVCSGSGYRN